MRDTFWKPVLNKRIRTKPRRHHSVICPYCGCKCKNINFHYKTYHPETVEKLTGEFGTIYGFRMLPTETKE